MKEKYICPICGGEKIKNGEDEICADCGSRMDLVRKCPCCRRYNISGYSPLDYCNECRNGAEAKLRSFLKNNFSLHELIILEAATDDGILNFIK